MGVGHQRSRGVKAGVITDLDEAEAGVRATIAQAERMAGVTLEEVLVSVSCGRLKSQNFAASAEVESRVVTDEDIARVMAGGRAHAESEGRTLVHLNRLGFRLDGVSGMRDPRGMAARKITADLHAVTADDAPVRNLLMVIERCYLNVAGLIPSGLAERHRRDDRGRAPPGRHLHRHRRRIYNAGGVRRGAVPVHRHYTCGRKPHHL